MRQILVFDEINVFDRRRRPKSFFFRRVLTKRSTLRRLCRANSRRVPADVENLQSRRFVFIQRRVEDVLMRNIDKYKLYPGKMSVLPEGWEIFKTYNLRQAAAMLGVCDKTLKKLAESGQIQCRRVGRRWIFCDRALRE